MSIKQQLKAKVGDEIIITSRWVHPRIGYKYKIKKIIPGCNECEACPGNKLKLENCTTTMCPGQSEWFDIISNKAKRLTERLLCR